MPLPSDDDLRVVFTPDMDQGALERKLSRFVGDAVSAGKEAGVATGRAMADALAKIKLPTADLKRAFDDLGILPDLVERRQDLEKITDELLSQLKVQQDIEKANQSLKNQGSATPAMAEAATRKRLEIEDKIADAMREQSEIEGQLAHSMQNSPRAMRLAAEEKMLDALQQERDKLLEMRALDDPRHEVKRLDIERQIRDVRIEQAAARQSEAGIKRRRDESVEHITRTTVTNLQQTEDQSDPAVIKERVRQENLLAEAHQKYADALEAERKLQAKPAEALDARAEVMREVTKELAKQRSELERQRLLLDPEVVKKRLEFSREESEVAHQRAVAEAQARLDPAAMEETVRRERELLAIREQEAKLREAVEAKHKQPEPQQRAERPKLDIKEVLTSIKKGGLGAGIKSVMSGLLKGVDLPQLVAGALGALKGQGIKGALGAVAGGIAGAGLNVTAGEPRPAQAAKVRAPAGQAPGRVPPAMPSKIGPQAAGEVAGAAMTGGAEAGIGAGAGVAMEAAGGPIGLAELAAQAAAKVGGQLAKIPFKVISGGLNLVNDSLSDLQGPLGPVGAGLNLASKGFDKLADSIEGMPIVSDLLGPVVRELGAMPGALKGMLETLANFAGKASPVQIKLLSYALDDVQAVIGQAFIPVLDMVRDGIRLFGDVLANIIPSTRDVQGALGGLRGAFDDASKIIRDALGAVGPQIRGQFTEMVKLVGDALAKYVPDAAKGMVVVLRTLSELLKPVASLLGTVVSIVTRMVGGTEGLSKSLEAMGRMITDVASYIAGAMKFWDGLSKAVGVLLIIPKTIMQVVGSLTGVSSSGELFTGTLKNIGDALGAVGSAVGFVSDIITGAVGYMVAPVKEGFAAIRSAFGEFGSIFADLKESAGGLLSEVGRLMKDMVGPLVEMVNPLKVVGAMLKNVAGALSYVARQLRSFLESLGLIKPKDKEAAKSGSGAAAREASFQSIDQYQQSLQLAAATTPGEPTHAELPSIANKQLEILQNIQKILDKFTLDGLTQAFRNAIPGPPPALAGFGAGIASGAGGNALLNWLRERLQ